MFPHPNKRAIIPKGDMANEYKDSSFGNLVFHPELQDYSLLELYKIIRANFDKSALNIAYLLKNTMKPKTLFRHLGSFYCDGAIVSFEMLALLTEEEFTARFPGAANQSFGLEKKPTLEERSLQEIYQICKISPTEEKAAGFLGIGADTLKRHLRKYSFNNQLLSCKFFKEFQNKSIKEIEEFERSLSDQDVKDGKKPLMYDIQGKLLKDQNSNGLTEADVLRPYIQRYNNICLATDNGSKDSCAEECTSTCASDWLDDLANLDDFSAEHLFDDANSDSGQENLIDSVVYEEIEELTREITADNGSEDSCAEECTSTCASDWLDDFANLDDFSAEHLFDDANSDSGQENLIDSIVYEEIEELTREITAPPGKKRKSNTASFFYSPDEETTSNNDEGLNTAPGAR